MDKIIYGADSETMRGPPISLQFYSEDVACEDLIFVNETTARAKFVKWLDSRRKNCQHVVYVHVLDFDLVSFLWGSHAKLNTPSGDFSFSVGRWTARGVYGTPTFVRFSDGAHTTVYFVDSFSFFRGSLAKAAEVFCPQLPKLKRLEGLGEKRFTARDSLFCEYAMRDAEIAYHIGRAIEALHQEYDLQQCYSVAHLAERIFRHRFLTYTIPQPSRDCIEAALLSYHGGKNNVTAKAGWHTGVRSLDISSAYPHAMHGMPAFSNPKAFRRVRISAPYRRIPEYGIYRVRGRVADCPWPVLFSHGFKPLCGDVEGVYIQGFELREAIASGEFKPTGTISGWCYDIDKDPVTPALRAFVETFYGLKERETDKVLRYMYKLILNSISGKFIQTRKRGVCAYTDIDAGVTTTAAELEAGGMFHPFIASAITAHTRARIHGLEHDYRAIHTATDGIFTQRAMLPRDLKSRGIGLGALTQDYQGELMLVRNKCYILYTDEKTDMPSRAFEGKYIAKEARHGFQGKVHDLERLIATGQRKYTVDKPWRLKEALKRGKTPNEFRKQEYTLKVGPLAVVR